MNELINLSKINYIPEYNLDLNGWNSNHFIFDELINEIKPSIIVEVGTWKGASAINMANIIKKIKTDTKIFCIDTWLGAEEFWTHASSTDERDLKLKYGYPQIYYQFLSNVFHCKHQDVICPIPNTSNIGSIILKYNKITADLIYIDGSHEYNDVILDLENFFQLLNSNGVIFGDDFTWPSVKNAVEKFCIKYNIFYNVIDNFWVIKK